jgi:tetratricopeptide (TPR) repeat protein
MSSSYNNIGLVYFNQGNYEAALKNRLDALKIREKIGEKRGISISYSSIGDVYTALGRPKEGKIWNEKALLLSKEMGEKENIKTGYKGLAKADSALGNYKEAFANYKMFIVYRDSLVNDENTKKTVQQQMQFEFDKKEASVKAEQEVKDQKTASDKKQQQVILFSVSGVLLLVIAFAFFVFRNLRVTQKQKFVIEQQKQEVEEQKHLVEEKQKEILDSIRYAKRIQTSLLPTEKYIIKSIDRTKN